MNQNILYHGTYVGNAIHGLTERPLKGQTALVRCGQVAGTVEAQFDEFWTKPLCFNWHSFPESEFVLGEPVDLRSEP